MNICFLINNISNIAGSEKATVNIANEMIKTGHNVYIISICGTGVPGFQLDKKIKVYTIFNKINDINAKTKYIFILRKINKLYRQININISIDVFSSLSLFTIPIKYILSPKLNLKIFTWEHFNFDANVGMNKIARKFTCKYSDEIIVLTQSDVDSYKKNIKNIKANLDYIYNALSCESKTVSNLSGKNIVAVGRLEKQKGFDLLLKAWKFVEENSDWNLLIVGGGREYNNLLEQAEAAKIKHCIFTGETTDVKKYYLMSSIYVCSSRFEGLPFTLIEAQNYGLPIVSFDCKTGPSDIIKHGVDGVLVEPENIEELANQLLLLINNPDKIRKYGANAKINSKRFNIKEVSAKWIMKINNYI